MLRCYTVVTLERENTWGSCHLLGVCFLSSRQTLFDLTPGVKPDSADGVGVGRAATSAEAVDEERSYAGRQGPLRQPFCLLVPQPCGHIQPVSSRAGIRRVCRAGERDRGGGNYGRLSHAGGSFGLDLGLFLFETWCEKYCLVLFLGAYENRTKFRKGVFILV